jgi:hypothetical protein
MVLQVYVQEIYTEIVLLCILLSPVLMSRNWRQYLTG